MTPCLHGAATGICSAHRNGEDPSCGTCYRGAADCRECERHHDTVHAADAYWMRWYARGAGRKPWAWASLPGRFTCWSRDCLGPHYVHRDAVNVGEDWIARQWIECERRPSHETPGERREAGR